MRVDEVWAIEYSDAEAFLFSEGFRKEGEAFIHDLISVKLKPCEDKTLGMLNLKRTRVIIEAVENIQIKDKETLSKVDKQIINIYTKFQLKFLKGGG